MKTIDIKPVTGYLDARSNPEDLTTGEYRYVQNIGVTQKNKLCRIPGWDKLLTRTDYNNQDLHDQLLSLTELNNRYPITFLLEATSTRRSTKLIAGTEMALYALNNGTGNWKIISDELGVSGARWRSGQLGDVVLFSNGKKIVYWNFDQAVTETNDQSVAFIPDLITIGITRAAVLISYKSSMFLMNVVQNGSVVSNRIVWSNFERPLSYVQTTDSTAGNFDIDSGETILGAESIGNSLLVYTNKGIWEGSPSGSGISSFVFIKRYSPTKTGENCLFYPNTLVSVGNEHVYLGSDGIYLYNQFLDKPKLVDWMHKASSLIFDFIDRAHCDIHVGAYNSDRKELLFSFARTGEDLPSQTLVLNTEFPFSYLLDHGFSAMSTHVVKEPVSTVRQWLLDHCICTVDEFNEDIGGFVKEGQFCSTQPVVDCPTPPDSIFSTVPLELEPGIETEDYNGTVGENSLCSQLNGITISELCESEFNGDQCNSGKRFVVASSADYCVKEFSQNMYRERCSSMTGCGTYVKDGYKSILRTGPMSFNIFHDLKELHRLSIELNAPYAIVPGKVGLRIGISAQALDPNDDSCGIVWTVEDSKTVQCLSDSSPANHKSNNTIPNDDFDWPLFYSGKYMCAELTFSNPLVNPVDTGVSFCMSRISYDLDRIEKPYP